MTCGYISAQLFLSQGPFTNFTFVTAREGEELLVRGKNVQKTGVQKSTLLLMEH